jgi:hypothetical protein
MNLYNKKRRMNFEQHILKIREDYYNFLNKYVKDIFYQSSL